jgi:hypothetical protein
MGLKQYPLVYSTNARTRRDLVAIALAPLTLIIAVSLLAVVGLVNKAVTRLPLLAMAVLAGLWALLASRWARRRVILYEDCIEVSGLFLTRKLKRSEILGRRMGGTDSRNAHGGAHYVIVPVDKGVKELRLPPYLNGDKDFRSWMDGIPKIARSEVPTPDKR